MTKARVGVCSCKSRNIKIARKPLEVRKGQGRIPLQVLEGAWPC